ncbi:MAG TPA: alpha/beta family hydrolase [Candidatus Acidoferrum sp.]|jgi:alpha/beta superfamily hydrolase|nr:alpha/beta family hydrolase [Candidatus Acidoferrum sp.]
MADVFHRSISIPGPAGSLEALLWTVPSENPDSVALVCHPHPLFGGTMHNKVVFQAAKTLHAAGMPVLRFNFRGVGLSQGVHDGGLGERGDVRAAMDYLTSEFMDAPILLAGFSFGSDVGLRVGCADPRVRRLIGLGIPLARTEMTFLRECAKPKLLISGGKDEFGPREKIEALFATLPEPKRLHIVEGADHFFAGRLDEVGATITDWLAQT